MTTPLIRTERKTVGRIPRKPLRQILTLLQSGEGRRTLRRSIGQRVYRTPPHSYFNEAVNPDLGIIYVAIPKTGTTTIREQISPVPHRNERYLVPAAHLDINQIKHGLIFFNQYRRLDSNRTFPHSTESTADITADAQAFFGTAFKFSTVRNPWARAVSLYFRKEGVQVSDALSFAEFIERHEHASDTCRSSTLHQHQYDWLVDERGDIAVDYVFRIEDIDTEIDRLREMSQGRVLLTPHTYANVNQDSKSNSYRDMYDDRLRKLVSQRFEKDIDHFKYTF